MNYVNKWIWSASVFSLFSLCWWKDWDLYCCWYKLIPAANCWNDVVFNRYKIRWYNYSHANKCVDVEHEEKSLNYRPLMNVVNQCEANSPLMSMSAKVPKYNSQSVNKWADVEPLARSDDQGTLMYSHDCQRENLSLMHTSLKVLLRTLVLDLDNVLMSIG